MTNPKIFMLIILMSVWIVALAEATVYDLGLPPSSSSVDETNEFISSSLMKMDPGDTFFLTNTESLVTIACIRITDTFENKKPVTRSILLKKLYPTELKRINTFLEKNDINRKGEENLNIVGFLSLVADRRKVIADKNYNVILIGSPLFYGADAYNMIKGSFPSDGHLVTDNSVFSTNNKTGHLENIKVFLIYNGEKDYFISFARDIHRRAISRFWNLFIHQQGGSLCQFSPDFSLLDDLTICNCRQYSMNEKDLVVVKHVIKPVALEEWVYNPPAIPPDVPAEEVGSLVIGLKWSVGRFRDVDLDLYVKLKGYEELSYQHTANNEGVHIKDHIEAPKNGYETVAFHGSLPIRDLDVYVNHYSGDVNQDITGKLRISFNGTHYFTDCRLTSRSGDHGTGDRLTSNTLAKIDVVKAVGLN